jgi:uncharacterized membrane protein
MSTEEFPSEESRKKFAVVIATFVALASNHYFGSKGPISDLGTMLFCAYPIIILALCWRASDSNETTDMRLLQSAMLFIVPLVLIIAHYIYLLAQAAKP